MFVRVIPAWEFFRVNLVNEFDSGSHGRSLEESADTFEVLFVHPRV